MFAGLFSKRDKPRILGITPPLMRRQTVADLGLVLLLEKSPANIGLFYKRDLQIQGLCFFCIRALHVYGSKSLMSLWLCCAGLYAFVAEENLCFYGSFAKEP